MLPDYPNIKKLIAKNLHYYYRERVKFHMGPFFGSIPQSAIQEGEGYATTYNDGLVHEEAWTVVEAIANGSIQEIIDSPSRAFEILDDMARQSADGAVKMILNSIEEITRLAGNQVSSSDGPFEETFFEIIERIYIPFDSEGKPKMPSILCGATAEKNLIELFQRFEKEPELQARHQEIMNRKRIQHDERENNRKLVD